MNRRWEVLLAVAGLGLFGFVASRIGWSTVLHALEQARTAIFIIVALSLVRLFLQAGSWSIALTSEGIHAPLAELLLIRLAAQGVGYLSVLGPLASEPMKISLLRKRGLSQTAATLVDSGVYWFTSGIVGIAGCLAATLLLAHSRHLAVSLTIFGLIVAIGLVFIARPKTRLSPLVKALGSRSPRWLDHAMKIEVAIREFENRHPSSVRRMMAIDAVCQLLLAAEVVALFVCFRIPLHAGVVLAIEGASRAIKMIAGWMPARIGADESGFSEAFAAFGLSPASGLALALARRSRDLLAAFIGLVWLGMPAGFRTFSSNEEAAACKQC